MNRQDTTTRDHQEGYHPIECPICHSEQDYMEAFLGQLGDVEQMQCRYCGGLWSREL